MRTPSDAEINDAAVELGLVGRGEPLTPRLRAKVAKTIQLAGRIDAEEQVARETSTGFAAAAAATYTDLVEAGIPDTAAARVVAAIAPQLWRDNQGAAHAPR
ncbi:hypothetical protein ACTHQY_08925 [Rhodococcoides corynebacterioides]|uniref:hypothetical protein n=1 Tax=Rhodococcoides corynebacterioides TaxID=53972 RepID=UPI003F7D0C5A